MSGQVDASTCDNIDTSKFWEMRDEEAAQQQSNNISLLLQLARRGPVSSFVALLESSDTNLDFHDESGWTPLLHASFNGHYEIVEAILNYQREKVSTAEFRTFMERKVKWNGSTSLHLAAARGHSNVVALLIESNQLNIDETDFDSATPLHCAVLGRHYETAQVLLNNGAAVNLSDIRGKTPMDWSVARNQNKFVLLLQNFENNNNDFADCASNDDFLSFPEQKQVETHFVSEHINSHNMNRYYQCQSQPMTIHQGPRFWSQKYANHSNHSNHANHTNHANYSVNFDREQVMGSIVDELQLSEEDQEIKSCTEESPESVSVPSADVLLFQNKYFNARVETLEKELQQQRIEYNQRYEKRERELFKEVQLKQQQIRELRHTLRQTRLFMDNLPVKLRRNFYRNFQNLNENDFERNKSKQKAVDNDWLTINTETDAKNNKPMEKETKMQKELDVVKTVDRNKHRRNDNSKFLFAKRNSNSRKNRFYLSNDFAWRKKQ